MRDLRANSLVLGLVRWISSGSGSSEGVGYSLAVSGRCRLCRLQLLPRHDYGLMHIVAVLPATAPQTRMHLQHEYHACDGLHLSQHEHAPVQLFSSA